MEERAARAAVREARVTEATPTLHRLATAAAREERAVRVVEREAKVVLEATPILHQ